MKIGIVYYSRTGNTRKIAKILEEKFKEQNAEVDLIEIEHVKKPGFFSAGRAAMKQQEFPIKNTDANMGKYDVIIAGSPTWAGRPSPFVKTFLTKAENKKGKHVAVFGTGMSPLDKRDEFHHILKNDLESLGLNTIDHPLSLLFKKGELIDGGQYINTFVDTVLKIKS